MELLIPGLILVALMVYASTRIKKSAAEAYEAETIETDEFVINKPEGFLHVLNGDPQYEFESYSKEYGAEGAEEFRKGIAKLQVLADIPSDDIAAKVLTSADEVVSDTSEVMAEMPYRVIETRRTAKDVATRVFHKIAERNGRSYHLEITLLSGTTEELLPDIETMLNSFELRRGI